MAKSVAVVFKHGCVGLLSITVHRRIPTFHRYVSLRSYKWRATEWIGRGYPTTTSGFAFRTESFLNKYLSGEI